MAVIIAKARSEQSPVLHRSSTMTLGPNDPVYDPITHRPTLEFIRSQAKDHVAYGWTSRPGTNNRDIVWTDEDTATYMVEYRAALSISRQLQ